MADAVPHYLDPALGSTPPRPPGFRVGEFPLQANAATLAFWTIGVSTRAIRQPFGTSMGEPLHYEYDLSPTNLLAIDCRGDPQNPDDRSVIQVAQDNPPQAGRVFTTWFWYDWTRGTPSSTAAYNRSLATKTANAYLGQQSRAGQERPVLAVSGLTANGGVTLSGFTDVVLAAPGSATKATLDAPLVAEDGSGPAPQPLRVPCWVGRWGHRGVAGQVLAGGSSSQNLGFVLKLRPLTLSFSEDAANLKIAFTAATAEYGCETYGHCAYTQAFVQEPATYLDPDFIQPGPPFPCKVYGDRCFKSIEQTASIQVFLTPLGDTWQVVVATHQIRQERTTGGGRYVLYGNFVPGFYTQQSNLTMAKLPDAVDATAIAFGTTTTITRTLFGGTATATIEIAVSATGTITLCEVRITRDVAVTNVGPGWHDVFRRL